MEAIISGDVLESLLSRVSSEVQQYQCSFSPSYQTYRNRYRRWLDKLDLINSSYDPAMVDEFLDYAEPIENYCFVQGMLSAVGCLSGQAIKLVDHKKVPGLETGAQKLQKACECFVDELPENERMECAGFFEERKQAIGRSGDYFFLYGFELMFSLLNKTGHELSTEHLEKLYKMVRPET